MNDKIIKLKKDQKKLYDEANEIRDRIEDGDYQGEITDLHKRFKEKMDEFDTIETSVRILELEDVVDSSKLQYVTGGRNKPDTWTRAELERAIVAMEEEIKREKVVRKERTHKHHNTQAHNKTHITHKQA